VKPGKEMGGRDGERVDDKKKKREAKGEGREGD